MTCADARPLIDAYFDAELDLRGSLDIEQHLASCAACSAELRNLERLRKELTPEVFDLAAGVDLKPLERRIRTSAPARTARWSGWNRPVIYAAIAAALAIGIFVPVSLRKPAMDPGREVVDSHLRSLMPNHLVDVPSSDQHTVKPWFQGKLDFAPDVADLGEHGFPLVGGRLDVIAGHPAAALVYQRRNHYLNLWIARSSAGDTAPVYSVVDGYQTVVWRTAGMERWVVSDVNRSDIGQFVDLIRNR